MELPTWMQRLAGPDVKMPCFKQGIWHAVHGGAHLLEERQRKDMTVTNTKKDGAVIARGVTARGGVPRLDQIGGQKRLVLAFGGYLASRCSCLCAARLGVKKPRWHEKGYQQTRAYAGRAYTDPSRPGSGGGFSISGNARLAT